MIWLLIYKRENTMDNTNRCLWSTGALNEVLEPFTIVKKTSTLRGDGKNHWQNEVEKFRTSLTNDIT
jgi:hypothetical protein